LPRRGNAVEFGAEPGTIPLVSPSVSEPMAPKLPNIDQWIDAMAPIVDLEITPEQRPGVKAQLKTAAKMAALLEKAPLKAETDAAPVFRA
jgi:hypothetical protein